MMIREPSRLVAALWLGASLPGLAMSWSLDGWGDSDQGIRDNITRVMNEAVGLFNAHTDINVHIGVYYHSGIPTAEANYPNYLGFGPSYINTTVALHEIAHALGSGTTWQWNDQMDGIWQGPSVRHFVKLYDGPFANINESGVHYWPYGLNYANEDSPQNRIRLIKIVAAMRADMWLDGGGDWDGDGLPDEWEEFRFGNLSQTGPGDTDADGISNRDERWIESDPNRACPIKDGHSYIIRAKHSQKVLEVAGGSPDDGANVIQFEYNGTDGQKWTALHHGDGHWSFINVASGKALEVFGFGNDAGSNIVQWGYWGGDYQRWRIVPDGPIYSKIFSLGSMNMCIDVEGGPGAVGNGANIFQYNDFIGGTNQDWAFDDITAGTPASHLRADYKLDGTPRDHSGREFHGVAIGGVGYGAGRVDGRAATFNGSDATIRVPASVDTNLSIACWVKTSATGGGPNWWDGMGLVDAEVPGFTEDFGLTMVGDKASFGVGNPETAIQSTSPINNGAWHHLVATLDTTSGAMSLHVDGTLEATGTGPAAARTAPANFHLGSVAGVSGFFNGSLDEVRLYKGLLSQTQITRLAGVGSTMVAGYGFDGDLLDAGGHANHGSGQGITTVAGKIGNAVQFNGTDSVVKIPAAVTGNFTVAYWVRTTATGGTGQWWAGSAMVDAEMAGATEDWGIALVGNKAGFGIGNPDKTVLSTTAINDNAWHHIAATRTTGGAMKLYVDGVLQASAAGPTWDRNIPGSIRLGTSLNGGARLAGAIDELRLYNYTLNASQVAALSTLLPAGWASNDLGTPGSDGYAGYSAAGGGTFTVVGGGTGIGANSDQCHFLSSSAAGDQTIVTRVDSIAVNGEGSTTAHARAGLMFRDSPAANAAFVDVVHDHTSGLRFMHRDAAGAAAGQVGDSVPVAAPFWLKLARRGDSFEACYATGGGIPATGDWVSLGSHATPLVAGPLAGMVVSPHDAGRVATAMFSHVGISATPSTPSETWRRAHFGNAANEGPGANDADPDHDGISNIFERAHGLDPQVANGAGDRPMPGIDGTFLTLSYSRSRAATDLGFQVFWSSDLTTWSAIDVTDTVVSGTATIEMRLARVPLSNLDPARGFLRLEVVE